MERYLNRRSTRWIYYKGVCLHLTGWAEQLGINKYTLSSRLNLLGWSIQRALTTPVKVVKHE